MVEITIALRYLWMARRKAHTAFLSLISTLGLAVGVATLLVSLALLSGLQGKIKSRLIASSPQLLIEPIGSNVIEGNEDLMSLLAKVPGADVRRTVGGIGWAADTEGEHGRPVVLSSFEPGQEPAADQAFGRNWAIRNPEDVAGIFLTRDLSNTLGVFLGDEVVIVSPRTKLTPFGTVPVWKKYVVIRLLPSPAEEGDPQAYLPFDEAGRLFGTGGHPTSIELYMPAERTDALQSILEQRFPGLLVKSWREINRPLFLALRLEKIVMFATISLVIFVAALNLISSLSMLIVEKRPQVGVLRTLGATDRSILRIFLGVGLLIGVTGTLLGNIIGLGFSWAAERYHLVPLPREVYYASHVPFTIDPIDVIGVNLVAITLSTLATWYPAHLAARLDPIAAIREEQ